MRVGPYSVSVHNHGFFRLDGGAMFGSVPKPLWSREAPPDDANRILLATRSLVIESADRRLIVDLGCGNKWDDKNREIFCVEPTETVPGISDVLLTHLHFDHAGGVSRIEDGVAVPCYPNARHVVSGANLDNARHPNLRERASYLPHNVDILEKVELVLTDDGDEVWPGLTVHRSDGHTVGLQWVKLTDGNTTIAFPADLIPTSKHLPLPFVMGYDMCAQRVLDEKRAFLEQAVAESWIVVFEHDPILAAGRVRFDERGRAVLAEPVALPTYAPA